LTEGVDMVTKFTFNDIRASMGKEAREFSGIQALTIRSAIKEGMIQETNKYARSISGKRKGLVKGSSNDVSAFYDRISSLLTVGLTDRFDRNVTGRNEIEAQVGFLEYITAETKSGGGGASLPELYYFGKRQGKPQKSSIFAKATKGNPALTRKQRRGTSAFRSQFSQSRGRYLIPEDYVSPAWKDHKEDFDKFVVKIRVNIRKRIMKGLGE
tara:strand:+ start:1523 stop:2158 length:636 start_codon:yes stop_codon:yes gene_type:complete